MRLILLIAFIAVPVIEIAVFIEVGGWIGLWPTLGLVILTAIVGSLELRSQGIATLNKLRSELDRGVLPAQTLFDGVCLLFAGALLLTPGFVTDAVGLALFLPRFRRFLRVTVGRRIVQHAEMHVHTSGPGPRGGPRDPRRGPRGDGVIDAEYVDVTDEPSRPDPQPDPQRGEQPRRGSEAGDGPGDGTGPEGGQADDGRDEPPRRLRH